jgi:Zn-finger nucleic acid-binding protein
MSIVVIDVCTRQHGVWLDAGELGAALAYATHRTAICAERAEERRDHKCAVIELEEAHIRLESDERIQRAKRSAIFVAFLAVLLVGWVVRHAHERTVGSRAESARLAVDRRLK